MFQMKTRIPTRLKRIKHTFLRLAIDNCTACSLKREPSAVPWEPEMELMISMPASLNGPRLLSLAAHSKLRCL